MKRRAVLCLSLLAFGSLACSGVGLPSDLDLPATAAPSASLAEPWSSMALPLGDGNVMYSDATSLSVTYPDDQVAKLGPKYRDALEGAGWKQIAELDNGDSYVLSYEKDGTTCGVAITFAAGQTVVGLTQQ